MSEPVTTENLSTAVADGLRQAVSDPAFWSLASKALQEHAKSQAGGLLFGWLKQMTAKLLWLVVIGTGVYLLGGWAALVAFIKAGVNPS